MTRKSDYIEDPIERAAQAQELHRYHFDLFQPIWEFNQGVEPDWLIKDWITKGCLAILAGPPKSGKTSLATQLALAVATGTPFAGMPTKQAAVLWLSLEENYHERSFLLNDNPLAQPSTPFYTCYEPLPIDKETTFDALDFWVTQTQAELIVIDPLQAAASGRALDNGYAARKTLSMLKRYCHRRRLTALVLHHTKAPTRYTPRPRVADHDQLSATASMLMIMTVKEASPDAYLSDSEPESPPHSQLMPSASDPPPHSQMPPSGDIVHEGGQGGETASPQPLKATPTKPKSKTRQESDSELSAPSAPLRDPSDSENSELKTQDSELTQYSEPVTRDPSPAPRLISLQCRGRGTHANRTIHLISSSPRDFRLADSQTLIKDSFPRQLPHTADVILKFLSKTSADAGTICAETHLNPFTFRNSLTFLRATGQIKAHKLDSRVIFSLPNWTADQLAADIAAHRAAADALQEAISIRYGQNIEDPLAEMMNLTRGKNSTGSQEDGNSTPPLKPKDPNIRVMFSQTPTKIDPEIITF